MGGVGPWTFLCQTLASFHTTGAVAPSSPFLAKAMVHGIPETDQMPDSLNVLEVGPGTGPFTTALAQRMNGRGRLQVYEINPVFVEHLKKRIETEACFQPMRSRISIHSGNILDLEAHGQFDAIVSGLPFNNFAPELVQRFLDHYRALLKPGGTLTFFEYAGLRRLQQPFAFKPRRERLSAISQIVAQYAQAYQYAQKIVWRNLPPARARYMRFPEPNKEALVTSAAQ